MLLGIDVGGTFTDAVILDSKNVFTQAKVRTNHNNILECLLAALDKVLIHNKKHPIIIERVVISSTLVTNALTEGKLEPVFLALISGPGMNIDNYLPVKPYYFSGSIDHRGKITQNISYKEHRNINFENKKQQICAVSGKFSVRNPKLELLLQDYLYKLGFKKIFLGSELSGELNFVRRTNSAYFSAQVYSLFEEFSTNIKIALAKRGIKAPIYVLKADGGTLPLSIALQQPIETIFTGPAASILGISALISPKSNSISLDVGGTTTDIAFWENGLPLMSKKGADINMYHTAVRSFYMQSIGIGGDSVVKCIDGKYKIGPQREGHAVALGGIKPTLSDALIVAGYVSFGDKERAKHALRIFGNDVKNEAEEIVLAAVKIIKKTIDKMLMQWEQQPVYTLQDMIKGNKFQPQQLIGVGGGSLGLIKALGEYMNLPVIIPRGAMVANAIGAAVAKPTLSAGLRADTTEGFYIIPESGQREKIPCIFNKEKAKEILGNWIRKQTSSWLCDNQELEVISYEHFHTIHGYSDVGDIYNIRMQLKPGILYKVDGRKVDIYD